MLEVVLVRHGETIQNRAAILQGQSPHLGRLTERGRAQASAVGVALRDEPFDAVLCSPLERAVLTMALIVCERRDEATLPLAFHPELREIRLGTLEGAPREVWPPGALDAAAGDFRPPGGESWNDLQVRVAAFFRAHVASREGRVLLVAHGGVNRAILTSVLGLPMTLDAPAEAGARLRQRNGCISRIWFTSGEVTAVSADDVRHMAALGDAADAGVVWAGDRWAPARLPLTHGSKAP